VQSLLSQSFGHICILAPRKVRNHPHYGLEYKCSDPNPNPPRAPCSALFSQSSRPHPSPLTRPLSSDAARHPSLLERDAPIRVRSSGEEVSPTHGAAICQPRRHLASALSIAPPPPARGSSGGRRCFGRAAARGTPHRPQRRRAPLHQPQR
jgi:hypothetical protein